MKKTTLCILLIFVAGTLLQLNAAAFGAAGKPELDKVPSATPQKGVPLQSKIASGAEAATPDRALTALKSSVSSGAEAQTAARNPNRLTSKVSKAYQAGMKSVTRTANQMGFMDLVTNDILMKFLEFAPQAPGHLLDLGCAWGYAEQQLLDKHQKSPFLSPDRKRILAVDISREHVDYVAANLPRDLVQAVRVHFPFLDTPEAKAAFKPNSLGAVYAGLVFHFLSGEEFVEGLKVLYEAMAPGARLFASMHTPEISLSMTKTFEKRKRDPSCKYPGWFDSVGYGKNVPEGVRKNLPDKMHVFDRETMKQYLNAAGFEVVEFFFFYRSKWMKTLAVVAEKKASAAAGGSQPKK